MSEELQVASAPNLDEFEMATTSGSLMLAGGNAFAHIQRVAKMFSSSDLVPDAFKGKIANCTIALEMAHRMGANPMAVMQNLYIVHGRPGWSAQFIIACLNQCGKFSPLRFEMTGEGDKRTCIAWAIELSTNERLEGPQVSIQMAKDESWYSKNGSKWKTMPELMLRYRAATFFGRLYAPDLLMGMQTAEELHDVGRPARDVTQRQGVKSDPFLSLPESAPRPWPELYPHAWGDEVNADGVTYGEIADGPNGDNAMRALWRDDRHNPVLVAWAASWVMREIPYIVDLDWIGVKDSIPGIIGEITDLNAEQMREVAAYVAKARIAQDKADAERGDA